MPCWVSVDLVPLRRGHCRTLGCLSAATRHGQYELMDGSLGRLRRVIAVGQAVELPAGGTLYVTALELWDRGVVLHAAEQLPEFFPPGEPIPPSRPLWMLTDDVGTRYMAQGGSGGGTQSHRRSSYQWESTVPSEASELYVVGPGIAGRRTSRHRLAVTYPNRHREYYRCVQRKVSASKKCRSSGTGAIFVTPGRTRR
jgi:hypothetical protein